MRLTIKSSERAAEYLRGKAVIYPGQFGRLPAEVRMRALTAAHVYSYDVLRALRDAVARLPAGGNWRELRGELAGRLLPWLDNNGVAARARAELILRTHGTQAYAVARYAQQQATKEALPYWQYLTVGDGRVRASHAALDGKVLRADDPFWETHYPPWDFGCRCVVVALPTETVERQGLVVEDGAELEERIPNAMSDFKSRPGSLEMSVDDLAARYGEDWGAIERRLGQMEVGMPEGGQRNLLAWLKEGGHER